MQAQQTKQQVMEEMAKNIRELADSTRKLLKGPVNRKGLVLLLSASSGLNKGQVELMLNALETMDRDWLNK